MARIVAALIGGVLLGIAVTWAFIESDFGPVPLGAAVREMDNVPQMTAEVAEAHRQERFEELTTIAEIFALPDRYMRSEALYALAGRSSASDVQKLIFEALGIADEYDRAQALNDLFFRLTSLDPRSALALAQSEYFANDSSLERTVWREWARMDLDEALFAAKTQPSRRQQNVAAQGLYSAFGLLGNETAERIEAELGIGPDRLTRGSYIYRLADNSVEEAIAFINGLDSAAARNDYISWLGFYLSMQDTAMAMTYAHLFERPANRDRFTQLVQNNAARENPQLVLDRYMNSSGTIRYSNEFYTAARQLVGTDIESARHYFEQATSRDARRYLGIQIVAQMVRDDPAAALAWARENDTGDGPGEFERAALAQIAYSDPAFALDEALSIENAQDRSRALSSFMA